MKTLSPGQFQSFIQAPEVQVLDVRTQEESQIASLPDSILLPLHELPAKADQLDPNKAVAIYCHHGVRSEQAGRFLIGQGFENVVHLGGGIDAWSLEIDSTVARY